MAKWYGVVGFAMTVEDPPESGIWKEQVVEKKYRGELLRESVSYENGESINDNLTLSNEISIVADSYILQNAYCIKYVTALGGRWKVRNISTSYPRITLSIGGVYNGREGPQIVSSRSSEGDS